MKVLWRTNVLRFVTVGLPILTLMVAMSGAAAASDRGSPRPADPGAPEQRVIARFSSAEGRSRALAIAAAHHPVGRTGSDLLLVPEQSLDAALTRIRSIPGVASVEEDVIVRLAFTPNDAYFLTDPLGASGQWDMRITATDLAWDLQRGSASVIVAVIDTGADYTHPDLAPALLSGRVLLSTPGAKCAPSSTAADDNGHGTHVAGTIAAVGGNGRGIAGMAFGVRVMPFKTLDCEGAGRLSDMATAITDAADAGARVINMSVGSTSSSPTTQAAVDYAVGRGSLVVAAAGNCGITSTTCPTANSTNFPAAYPNVLAVGATDANDQPASFSTAGSYVAVSAPGARILSTYPMNRTSTVPGYALFSGTSMATPHVSGLAALLLSGVPSATVAQLRTAIVSTAKDVGVPGRDDKTGAGRIDSLAALRWIRAIAAPASACVSTVGPGIPPPAGLRSGMDGFHASWYGQSGYMTLCPGATAIAVVAYYNIGSRGWVKGRMGEVAYLGTWDPIPGQDRPSVLGGDGTMGSPNTGWPRYDRVAVQPADYVGPGQVAWFQFTVRAPATPGTYKLYIRPLIEGATWMEDYGVYWEVVVRG
jgi:subtilisin family serine protease